MYQVKGQGGITKQQQVNKQTLPPCNLLSSSTMVMKAVSFDEMSTLESSVVTVAVNISTPSSTASFTMEISCRDGVACVVFL